MAFMRCKGCNSVPDPEKVKKNKFGIYCNKSFKGLHKKENNANKKKEDDKKCVS
jgi:hypothetical protein